MMRRNRTRTKSFLGSPITLILALVVLVFAARAAVKIHAKAGESAVRLAEATASLNRLETKEDSLKTRIADLSTPEGVEASIRQKYHAVEAGEEVAVIIDKDETASAAVLSTGTSTPTKGWWQRLLQSIGI